VKKDVRTGAGVGAEKVAVALWHAPHDARLIARGFALVTRAAPGTAVVYVALTLVLGLLPVAQVWFAKRVVDALVAAQQGLAPSLGGTALPALPPGTVLVPAVLYVLTLVVPGVAQPLQAALMAWLEARAVAATDHRLMATATRLVDLGPIERPSLQNELRLVPLAGHWVPRLFAVLRPGLGGAVALTGLLLLLGGLHLLIPLAIVAVGVPHFRAQQRHSGRMHRWLGEHSQPAREMDYCVRVVTDPAAAKEVRVFGLGGFFLDRFRGFLSASLAEVTALRFGFLRSAVGFAALYAAVLAGGFWYVAHAVARTAGESGVSGVSAAASAAAGRLTVGDVALYLNALIQAETQMGLLGSSLGMFTTIVLTLRRFFGFLDESKPEIRLAGRDEALPAPATIEQGIELRDVRFRYPEGTAWVLDGVSASLPSGRVTALVGANGAGKSTLVKLLTRMYDPTEGRILLDGASLEAYDIASLRGRTAVAYQDFARFSLTLRENILLGAVALENGSPATAATATATATASVASDRRVERAARWSGADEVAAQLPDGYDTELTRRFHGGVDLSGGEWQKVALARAFIRDAALVILDEPTAALDADAEYALFQRFRELVAGKTALLISHRFSTVRMADHILVLEDGRIREAGTHAELVARSGRYAELYEMQAGRYR